MPRRRTRLAPVPPDRLAGSIAIATTLLVALGAVGCGSSSTTTTATVAALSKPQFLAEANAICTQGNQRIGPPRRALGNHPSKAQIIAYVTGTFVPSIQSQIDGIRALAAPAADKAAVKTMLDVAQANLNRVKSNPLLLAGNSPPFVEFAKLAHPYGLTACAANN
ncbi:MAG: hypothetical protein ACHQC8_03715 [Solirubrobacterales bacterium]